MGLPALAVVQIYRHRNSPGASGEEDGVPLHALSQSSVALEAQIPPRFHPLSVTFLLSASAASRSYAYLTRGYKAESYLWEAVILTRKVTLAAVVVIWRDQGRVQLAFISFLVSIAGIAQAGARPFTSARANRLELASLLQAGTLALLGQLLLLSETETQRSVLTVACSLVLLVHGFFTLFTIILPGSRSRLSLNSRLKSKFEDPLLCSPTKDQPAE